MKPRRRARRHAQIHLPPLDAELALTLAGIFERAGAAIWRAHGERMAELLRARDAAPSAESEYVEDANPDAPEDTPF